MDQQQAEDVKWESVICICREYSGGHETRPTTERSRTEGLKISQEAETLN